MRQEQRQQAKQKQSQKLKIPILETAEEVEPYQEIPDQEEEDERGPVVEEKERSLHTIGDKPYMRKVGFVLKAEGGLRLFKILLESKRAHSVHSLLKRISEELTGVNSTRELFGKFTSKGLSRTDLKRYAILTEDGVLVSLSYFTVSGRPPKASFQERFEKMLEEFGEKFKSIVSKYGENALFEGDVLERALEKYFNGREKGRVIEELRRRFAESKDFSDTK